MFNAVASEVNTEPPDEDILILELVHGGKILSNLHAMAKNVVEVIINFCCIL